MREPNVGIVVPTLGTRPDYLRQCLLSIRSAGRAAIHIVAPKSANLALLLDPDSYDELITDQGYGLSAAINTGLRSLPKSVRYINWLGDDDLLTENSLDHVEAILESNPKVVLVFGRCEYIDADGNSLWLNKSGSYATYVMRCGPQLIPQPGALFRRESYEQIGGLNNQYKWAFDLDLLIRLSRIGRLKFTPRTLAKFRWHIDSLSVGGRRHSVTEASVIRIAALPKTLRRLSPLWEIPMRWVILQAGKRYNPESRRT